KKRLEKARQTWSVCQQGPEVICHNKKTAKLCQCGARDTLEYPTPSFISHFKQRSKNVKP
ncbi:unnamed protein product, partial [Cyprideis torosa]